MRLQEPWANPRESQRAILRRASAAVQHEKGCGETFVSDLRGFRGATVMIGSLQAALRCLLGLPCEYARFCRFYQGWECGGGERCGQREKLKAERELHVESRGEQP